MKQTRDLRTKEEKSKEALKHLDDNGHLIKNTLKNPYVKAATFLVIGYGVLIASKYVLNAVADAITAGKRVRKAVQQ